MCGITAVNSRKGAVKTALNILIQNERIGRGRSSTGVAFVMNNAIHIEKKTISPTEFAKSMPNELPKTSIVVGHNRLPSYGENTYDNAHPFLSCDKKFTMLHNGSENVSLAKDLLVKLGHTLKGETDSEVICHMICDKAKTMSLADAIQEVHKKLSHSTLLIMTDKGDIYGIGSNTFIIRDDDGVYVGSEQDSFLSVFKNQRKRTYETSDLFLITANGQLKFFGDVDKNRKKICEETDSKTVSSSFSSSWWNKWAKKNKATVVSSEAGFSSYDDEIEYDCNCDIATTTAEDEDTCDKCGGKVRLE